MINMVIDFVVSNQVMLGLLVGACLFLPWDARRTHFAARALLGVAALLSLPELLYMMAMPSILNLTVFVALVFLWALLCFDCSVVHAVFTATCAYTVQHITSKLAYMVVVSLYVKAIPVPPWTLLVLLAVFNVLVCAPIYLIFTRSILRDGRLMFNSVRTVLFAAFFLVVAVFLSSVLEENLDATAPTYLSSYLSLGAFCVLFAVTVLSLEITNCGVKRLETENSMLERLLEKDRLQYERAKEDMEKINIRYHDLKQQYSRVPAEERAGLESEMRSLSLRYLTGNKALDIVITQKASLCAQKGVQLICSADGEALGSMKSYHIYSLFGNAIDNAIECLDQVEDRSRRTISVSVTRSGDMAVIRFENYTPAEPVVENGALVTTKEDSESHGYGMRSIKGVAEKYGGTAEFFVRDHVFYLVVALPTAQLRPGVAGA